MKVIAHTEPAPDNAENEDSIVVADNLVGVLDGVSAPTTLDTGCLHGPAWYVRQLAHHITDAASSEPEGLLRDYLANAIRASNKAHEDSCDLANPHTPASTVSLLRQRGEQLDYLLLGDSPILVETTHGNVAVLLDDRFDTALEEIRHASLLGDVTIDSTEHAERLHQMLLRKQQLTNQPDGYWIASSNPDAAYHAITGTYPLAGAKAVTRAALLTDGASRAADTFGLLNWSALMKMLHVDGPAALVAKVRAAENADRAGTTQPRYKRHDDATAVLCLFDSEEP